MTRFVPSPAFDPIVQAAVKADKLRVAGEIVDVARESNNDDTGYYDDSLRVFDDRRGVGGETTDFAGHIIEYGDIHQPAQAPLRTGAEAAGRFDER